VWFHCEAFPFANPASWQEYNGEFVLKRSQIVLLIIPAHFCVPDSLGNRLSMLSKFFLIPNQEDMSE
jgi:hypothetical protein